MRGDLMSATITNLDDEALAAAFHSLAADMAPAGTDAHRLRAQLMDRVLDERLERRG